jgi:hypothetical protein
LTPLILKKVGKRCRGGRRHGLGHGERANALGAFFAGDVSRLDDHAGRWAAGAHDDAGAWIGHLFGRQTGVGNRLIHRDVVPGRAAAVKRIVAAIHQAFNVHRRHAVHLATEAKIDIILGGIDARFGSTQAFEHLIGGVANGGHDAHPGDDDTPHGDLSNLERGYPLGQAEVLAGLIFKETNTHTLHGEDGLSVSFHPAIGNGKL